MCVFNCSFNIKRKLNFTQNADTTLLHSHDELLYGELSDGKRSVGGQKKRFKDTLKASLKSFDIDTGTWDKDAGERPKWRSLIFKGCQTSEERRTIEAQQKRELRKSRAASTTTLTTAVDPSLICPTCSRSFRAKIGLISHLRTHKPRSSSI